MFQQARPVRAPPGLSAEAGENVKCLQIEKDPGSARVSRRPSGAGNIAESVCCGFRDCSVFAAPSDGVRDWSRGVRAGSVCLATGAARSLYAGDGCRYSPTVMRAASLSRIDSISTVPGGTAYGTVRLPPGWSNVTSVYLPPSGASASSLRRSG